ncbi:hypothetical protein AURDEDRAFT_171144 [Auricularia subglabra TFB-10046 SS5]|uniref:Uncharacterized protein n=1 Tax=Auricularia subglabra (strain TFB-10046 / SS5) TaxID=717982 RepID=J0WW31_AURST|nr:hypothetical protein AURDEDRAFT_171144 [Auricularia subglabra TFB-10046 SS5]
MYDGLRAEVPLTRYSPRPGAYALHETLDLLPSDRSTCALLLLDVCPQEAVPQAERAVKLLPKPAIPTPYVPYSCVPLSTELIVIAHTSAHLLAVFATLAPSTVVSCWFLRLRSRARLSTALWLLGWAWHTAQTAHNVLAIVRTIKISDCAVIVALVTAALADAHSIRTAHWRFTFCFWPATYFGPPVLVFGIRLLILAIQHVLKRRSSWPRRDGPGGKNNPATDLPPEVQLQILHLLRTRRRFGEREWPLFPSTIYPREVEWVAGWSGGVAPACAVCRARRDAATEALYSDVVLPNSRCLLAFVAALAARSELTRFVRRVAFPTAETRYPREDRVRHRRARPRVRRLEITSGHHDESQVDSYVPHPLSVLPVIERLPRIESLTLTGGRIPVYEDIPLYDLILSTRFSHIVSLSLDACVLHVVALIELLAALPGLRTAELRNLSILGTRLPAKTAFLRQHNTLQELIVSSTHRSAATASALMLGGLDSFAALRILAVNAHELGDLRILPPALERLIVPFAPYSTYPERACRRCVLAAVGELRRLRGASPGLRAVQLWDEIFLAQIRDWKIAAFMLRAMLGIEVEVNLFLDWEDLRWCRTRLLARKAFRLLYDT